MVCGVALMCCGEAGAAEAGLGERMAVSSNTLFLLLGAVMILAMHGGFAFLEVGSVRGKNQVNALNKILCEWSFSTLLYFLVGYHIAYGTSLLGRPADVGGANGVEYVRFFFLLGFAACIPAIISGGVAERAKFWTNALAGIVFVGIVYPLIEGMTWGQMNGMLGSETGWLPSLSAPLSATSRAPLSCTPRAGGSRCRPSCCWARGCGVTRPTPSR